MKNPSKSSIEKKSQSFQDSENDKRAAELDIALPGINGIEAFQRVRSIPTLSHIPVIALTASAMEKDREAILSHGFDAYIAKPIIAKEFFKVINEVLYGK